MAYSFDQIFAADPSNPSNVAQNASITIFAPGDATMTPLTITDPDGQPLNNPIPVNANGFGSAFAHATLDRVAWAGGGFTGFFTSYEGMKGEAQAAREAAEQAAADAASAAQADLAARIAAGDFQGIPGQDGANVLPTDTAIKNAINNPASETRAALATATASKLDTLAVQPPQVGAMMQKLRAGIEAVSITGLGDSTMAMTTGWFNQLTDWLGAQFPAYTVKRRAWSDTNQRYEMPTTIQTGTAGERRFVTTGASTDRFFTVADSPETSPSTALVFDARASIPAAAAVILGGKYDTVTNNRAWFLTLNAGGTLSLFFSTDGTGATQLTRTSTAALPGSVYGTPTWYRVKFNGNNGAAGNEVSFFYSTDAVTWTQLGTTLTNAGTQTIFDSNASTQFVSRSGSGNASGGAVEYYAFRLWNTLTATARPVVDFDMSLWSGYGTNYNYGGSNVITFKGFSGTEVRVEGTGNGGTIQGAPVLNILNGGAPGRDAAYVSDATRFPKLTPVPSDLTVINLSHNEMGLIAYRTPYKAIADAVLAKWPDTGILAVVQNQRKAPALNITEHTIRSSQIAGLAASQRWSLLNIADAFRKTGAPDTYIDPDGIHPTQAGYDLAALAGRPIFSAWL